MSKALPFIQDKYNKLKTASEKAEYLTRLVKQNFVQNPKDTDNFNQFDLKVHHYTGKEDKCTAGMLATIQYRKGEADKEVCCVVEIVDPNTNLGIFYSNFEKQDSRTTKRSVTNETMRIAEFGHGKINLKAWRQIYGFAI